MLNRQINFISAENERRVRLAILARQIRKLAYAALVLVIIVSFSTLVIQQYYRLKTNNNLNQIEQLKTSITKYNQLESSLEVIQSRAKLVKTVVNKDDSSIIPILQSITRLVNAGLSPSGNFKIKVGGAVAIDGWCNDLDVLARVEDEIEQLISDGLVKSVFIDTVYRSSSGNYSITMRITG